MFANEAISYLGHRCRDKITGVEGVADSVGFDLYGCVQVSLNGGFKEDGSRKDAYWFDINRLEIISQDRVMPVPSQFLAVPEQEVRNYDHGPANKPAPYQRA